MQSFLLNGALRSMDVSEKWKVISNAGAEFLRSFY